ncbi:MAG: hypothetical protein QME48_06435 [bacterium]|uniref:Lipoprotein n=2 Tax=Bacteria candidate phyla TaxID=1783234 RepID=A0A101I4C9_UNCT6|nr:MAG: hypothetical protein XD76_0136 [candidate division TA06 bacterium 32_111]KUK88048.1 MAG: hypothetical protein XE03_0054 [candidate division TA06 bacterium 34_109]MDI6700854.1 hypothetical protein [bacterium]HAF06980.1 hypothetical protein [candidate division WOR-3 bacterium]HCP16894.1 hypothetical protein [candidate division WOR-3 bacterium]
MRVKFYFLLIILFLISCSLSKETSINIKKYEDLIVYNNSFNKKSSISIEYSILLVDTISQSSDIIVTSFASNSIVFLSPSKDTILSKGNSRVTGFYKTGEVKYNEPPLDGYFDMEYPIKNNWYFVKTFDGRYLRIYVKEVCQDSLICDVELLNDTVLFFP